MKARLLLVPCCLFTAVAHAQTMAPRIGVVGGLNESQAVGSVSDISNRGAGVFGAYVVRPFAPDWSVQLGALLSMKGWERDEPTTHDLSVVKLSYVEVPALLRYDIAAAAPLGGVVFAGPSVQFRTSCSIDATTHATGVTISSSCTDIERVTSGAVSFASHDFGAIIGAGVRAAVGGAQLLLTAQYERGLTDNQPGHDIKNSTYSLAGAVEIPIFRK